MNPKATFLCPISRYHGKFTPENLAFNANLQEFANSVSLTCALETGGKISPTEAIERIEALWKQLEASKQHLGIGASSE